MIIKINKTLNFKRKSISELNISNDMKDKINNCWMNFIKDKTDYWNGDIFVVADIDLNKSIIKICKTKYSSIVYAKRNKDLIIKPLFTSILLKTKDDKYIIIKNNHNCINLIGGMADYSDFEDDKFSPDLCIKREVDEEIGIDLNDDNKVINYQMKYLKVPTNDENYCTIGILYTGTLNYNSEEFKEYTSSNKFDCEIKEYYCYSKEECLNLELKKSDISYLKEFILIESNN